MRSGKRLGAVLVLAALAACGSDGLLQGDGYQPDGTLASAPVTDRRDAGPQDAGAVDSGFVVEVDGGPPPENTCLTARPFGQVSGDTGSTTTSTKGTCSEWVSVRVTEDDSSTFGAAMRLTLTLTPTVGSFSMFVFFDPDHDVVACALPPAFSSVTSASLKWGEGTLGNNADDSRTVSVYVRSNGACPPNAAWSITADGNK